MTATRMFHIVLRAKPTKAYFFLAVMQAIGAAMETHAASFATPPVDPGTFNAQVASLAGLQKQARARVPGAAAARDEAIRVVAASAELLRAYVEQLCNNSPEQGATLAQAAAMQIARNPVRAKVPLRARQGAESGAVILYASASLLVTGRGGRFFSWEYSLDGGATWLAAASTPNASTTISGLPVLKECAFRVSVTGRRTGQGP